MRADAAGAIIRSSGVVLLEGRVSRTPNDPVLQGARGGVAGGGRANIRTFIGGNPAAMFSWRG